MKLSEVRAQSQQQAAPKRLKLSEIRAQTPPEQAATAPFDPVAMQQRARETFQTMTRDDELRKRAQDDLAAGMGIGETLVASLDYGTTALGQAMTQIGQRADKFTQPQEGDSLLTRAARLAVKGGPGGAALPGTTTDADIAKYDAQVSEDAQRFDEGIGKTVTGKIGSIIGGTLPTLPIGGVGGGGILKQAAKTALVSGASAAATTPVTDKEDQEDFAGAKARQFALGGAFGGTLSAAAGGLGKVAEKAGLGNLVRAGYNWLGRKAANSPEAIAREAAAKKIGVNLSPAKITGDQTQLMLENAASQNIFGREKFFQADMDRANEYATAVEQHLDKLLAKPADDVIAGAAVRDAVNDAVDKLSRRRSKLAAADYAEVDRLAKNAPSIAPDNYREAAKRIIDENSIAPKGSDARALADSMAELLGTAGDNGKALNALKTRRYLSQIAGGQASFSGASGQPIQRRAAAMLLKGLDDDIDAAAGKGGELGKALTLANWRYKAYSKKIDDIEAGVLGRVLGNDLGNDLSRVAPETIFKKFTEIPASQLAPAMKLLPPETAQAVKRAFVEKALKAGSTQAPAGAKQARLTPVGFVKALQSTGEKGADDRARLAAMFTREELKELDEIMDIGRVLGDKTGINTSGTNPQAQVYGLLDKAKDFGLKAVASTVGQVIGVRQLANIATSNDGRKALIRLRKLPPGSKEAKDLAAYIGGLAAAREGDE